MKLFPFILTRIAGLPFDLLQRLSWQPNEELEVLMEKYVALEKDKNELLQLLESAPDFIHCGFVLKNLAYLKKQLSEGKRGKLSKKLDSNLTKTEKSFLEKIEKQLNLYHQSLKTLERLENDFEAVYQKAIFDARSLLQKISAEPILLKGLLMSSHVFLGQLQKYGQAEITTFAKKQFQTERAFLRYLSRVCSKTSPFSTFTTLSVFDIEKKATQNSAPKTTFRLNNLLFALWRDALNNYPPFYRKLVVNLNPSLKKTEATWSYLLNTRNVESIQKLEHNELLDLIVENISEAGGNLIFENLVVEIHPAIETDLASLEAYLLELIDFGFLEWRWSFSGLDPFWDKKLRRFLDDFPEDQFLSTFKTSLTQIQKNIALAEKADFEQRKKCQLESFQIAKQISESLLEMTQLADKEVDVNSNQIKHFKANRFQITPERLFYEDVSIPFEPVFDASSIANLIEELDGLLENLNVLFFNSTQLALKHFFLENYGKSEAIDLLSFYEFYYKNNSKTEFAESKNAVELRLAWQSKLLEKAKLSDAILSIDLAVIESLAQQIKQRHTPEKQTARGSLIQLFQAGNTLKGFSESSFGGNGKMMGRFLHLFPQSLTEAVQNWNEKQRNGLFWIENVDASIYNPNLHPPLLPFEIRMPGSQNTLPPEKQISVTELAIVYNELEDKLDLIHRATDRKVYVFDLGFEALESRSPLYQLLATFNYQAPSQDILLDILNNYFDRKATEDFYFHPRICIGNHLIIQRKKWFIAKNILPLKTNSESESAYFIRINRWMQNHKIPSIVFITAKPSELQNGEREKTDDYKPQFIDFQNLVFVQLFHKLIKKVEGKLKIEEVLPYPAEKIKGKSYASEYLIQWETTP